MAEIQRMRPSELKELKNLLAALQALPGYAPHDKSATAASLEATLAAWDATNVVEVQKENETAAARAATASVEKRLRAIRTTAHTQVESQYGKDSDELASVGLKKVSEYKPRGRKPTDPPAAK